MIWEYKQTFCGIGQETKECNQAGADGWELTGFAPTMFQKSPLAQAEPAFMMIFKRPKGENGQDSSKHGNKLLISGRLPDSD